MGSYVEAMRALVGSRPLVLAAAGVVVEDPDGRVLLQRRIDDGLWGLPGGALELGETFEDAARRELREETGLVAGELAMVDVDSGPEFFLEYPNGDHAYVVGVVFVARGLDPQSPVADGIEGSELRFFDLSALPLLGMNPFNRTLLERYRHQL